MLGRDDKPNHILTADDIIDRMFNLKELLFQMNFEYQEKRGLLEKLFDKTAGNQIRSTKHTATIRRALKIDYDGSAVDASDTIPANIKAQIVHKEVVVTDYKRLVELMKSAGIKPHEFKELITVTKTVDKKKVEQLFDMGDIKLEDLEGCYKADVVKTITIK